MKTDIEDEETVGLPGAVTKIEFQGWQRRSSGKFTICYLVFLRKRRRWAFLNTLQALDPPTFKSFGLTFLRNDFEHHLFAQKQRDIDSFWQ